MASTELRAAAQQALEALEGGADSWQRVGPAIDALRAALAEPDLFHCPKCGGPADNGHDRSIPPSPYWCTKCMAEPVQEPQGCAHCNHPLYAAVKCRVCGRVTEPVQEPVLQALADADRVMGHDDESTEWRERWAHLFSCALTNGGYQCSCGASQKVHRPAPPQRLPLTEEEIQAAWDSVDMRHPRGNETRIAFARAIERAHKIGGEG